MEPRAAIKLPSIAPLKFFREVIAELKKVSWPTRAETVKLTGVVIIISIAVALFIGGLDIAFIKLSTIVFR